MLTRAFRRYAVIAALLALSACSGDVTGAGGGAGGGGGGGGGTAPPSPIPSRETIYELALEGVTYSGNTTFPTDQTQYQAIEQFSRSALLVVLPTQSSAADGLNNGVNARDVALFSGNAAHGEAGVIWFATNTRLFSYVNATVPQQLAALDVAYVTADEAAGTVQVVVDGNFAGLPAARTSQLNFFVRRTSLFAGVTQILVGQMVLQFAEGGASVSGQLAMAGVGYVQPGAFAITARFTGRRR